MTMRAPAADLPVVFADVTIVAGAVTILDSVSLALAPGAPTVLVGPNGAGKTTLLRAAMGLIPATRGHITWGGRETSPPDRRAILFQRPAMLRRSTAGNVRYALAAAGVPRGERANRAAELLTDVGLADLERRPARRLSGGEQQRLALARTLARDPALLLLDEPTASLDPDTGDWVRTWLERYRAESGCTILLASHNMAEVERLCSVVLMLKQGRIVDRGSPRELLDRYGREDMEEVFLDIARNRRQAVASA
jgi:tungstate transport system ATP-binding protein